MDLYAKKNRVFLSSFSGFPDESFIYPMLLLKYRACQRRTRVADAQAFARWGHRSFSPLCPEFKQGATSHA